MPFLDLTRAAALEFHEPAWDDFPCLRLAYRALEAERSLPVVLNAANEVAVASFLEGRLGFTAIARRHCGHHGRARRRPLPIRCERRAAHESTAGPVSHASPLVRARRVRAARRPARSSQRGEGG